MTQLIIFDLDGTLLNTIDDLAVSANYILRRHGYPIHELADYRFFVGNGITRLIERALPNTARNKETITTLRTEFVDYYQHHITDFTRPYPGIPELLKTLREKNIKLAVASNKYHEGTNVLIRYFFGMQLFDAVFGQRDNIPIKPDPAIINDILSVTGIAKTDTLYIGDSEVDMQTGVNSGVIPIGVTWGFRSEKELTDNGACHIVHRPDEILRYL